MTRDEEQQLGEAAWRWWRRLKPDPSVKHKGDPGALARLRRGSLQEAALEPATADLYRRINPLLRERRELEGFERAALIAAVLAHVRESDRRERVARAAGEHGDNAARLSPLRFRKILTARGASDCLIAFRRLVALLGSTVDVGDLAVSLAEWNMDGAGDRRRTRWAFDYYDAGAAAPDESQDAA
jgi:CRISPR type I-E-associated protein CasB/Cse2